MSLTALGAGIAATGSLISNLVNKRIEKNRYKQQLADQQKMWQMNNAYNSPAAQMARLHSAGLNPNLIYQNGGATATSDQITPPDWQNTPLDMFSDVGQMVQNIPQIEADVANKEAERSYTASLTTGQLIKNKYLNKQEKLSISQLEASINNVRQNTALLEEQTGLTRKDIDSYYIRLNNTLMTDQVQRMLGIANISKIQKEIDQINELINKTHDERKILQLEYTRGMIAKKVEEIAAQFEEQKQLWRNGQYKTLPKSLGQPVNNTRWWRLLDQDIEMTEKELLGKTISNITNPISDIALPAALFFIGRRTPKMGPVGFKHY